MLVSRDAITQSMLQMGRSTGSMMRSKLAGIIREEKSSINRDISVQISALHVQISTLHVQPPPDKQ